MKGKVEPLKNKNEDVCNARKTKVSTKMEKSHSTYSVCKWFIPNNMTDERFAALTYND